MEQDRVARDAMQRKNVKVPMRVSRANVHLVERVRVRLIPHSGR